MAANVAGGIAPWPTEQIPDDAVLYRWIHHQWFFPDGTLQMGFFQGLELSVRWNKYATADDTHRRCKPPQSDNAIISFIAGRVRAIDGLRADHTPLHDDRAHADIRIDKAKKTRARFELSRTFKVEISLEEARTRVYDEPSGMA